MDPLAQKSPAHPVEVFVLVSCHQMSRERLEKVAKIFAGFRQPCIQVGRQ
jgi:hypothetical protein